MSFEDNDFNFKGFRVYCLAVLGIMCTQTTTYTILPLNANYFVVFFPIQSSFNVVENCPIKSKGLGKN